MVGSLARRRWRGLEARVATVRVGENKTPRARMARVALEKFSTRLANQRASGCNRKSASKSNRNGKGAANRRQVPLTGSWKRNCAYIIAVRRLVIAPTVLAKVWQYNNNSLYYYYNYFYFCCWRWCCWLKWQEQSVGATILGQVRNQVAGWETGRARRV